MRGPAVGFLLLLAACGGDPTGGTSSSGAKGPPEVRRIGDFHYVVVDGKTPYERGLQHGQALRAQIDQGVRGWRRWLRSAAGLEAEQVVQGMLRDTTCLAAAKARAPDLVAEIQGIADGSGIEFNLLFAYGAFPETLRYLSAAKLAGHGTCLGLPAAEGRHALVAQNDDLPAFVEGTHTVLRVRFPDSDLQLLQVTWAGMLAQGGLNNRGLGVVATPLLADGHRDGLPGTMIRRRLLEQRDVAAAIASLEDGTSAAALAFVIGDAGRVACVEVSAGGVVVHEPGAERPFVAHANHPLGATPAEGDAGARLAAASAALAAGAGTLETLRELLATPPVCVEREAAFGRTVLGAIVEPGALKLHLTGGPPSEARHAEYRLFDFR